MASLAVGVNRWFGCRLRSEWKRDAGSEAEVISEDRAIWKQRSKGGTERKKSPPTNTLVEEE